MENKEIKNEYLRFIEETFFTEGKTEFFISLSFLTYCSFYSSQSLKNIPFCPLHSSFLANIWNSISEGKYIYIAVLLVIATGLARALAITQLIPLLSSLCYKAIGKHFKKWAFLANTHNITTKNGYVNILIHKKTIEQFSEILRTLYYAENLNQVSLISFTIEDWYFSHKRNEVTFMIMPYGFFILKYTAESIIEYDNKAIDLMYQIGQFEVSEISLNRSFEKHDIEFFLKNSNQLIDEVLNAAIKEKDKRYLQLFQKKLNEIDFEKQNFEIEIQQFKSKSKVDLEIESFIKSEKLEKFKTFSEISKTLYYLKYDIEGVKAKKLIKDKEEAEKRIQESFDLK